MIMIEHGYIFLGYIDEEKNSHFNLPLDEKIILNKDIDLIVLGNK